MSDLTQKAELLRSTAAGVAQSIRAAVWVDPAAAEAWKDPQWWQHGVKVAWDIPTQMIELAKWRRSSQTCLGAIALFLRTEGEALEAEPSGPDLRANLEGTHDELVKLMEYSVGAEGNIRNMKLPSIWAEIENASIALNEKTARIFNAALIALEKIPEGIGNLADWLPLLAALAIALLIGRWK